MDEIYKIRRELRIAQRKVQDMEALLCLRTAKIHSPGLAYKLVQDALRKPDEVRAEAEIKMEEATQKTALMKDEVTRLVERITALESAITPVGEDGTKHEPRSPTYFLPFED